MYVDRAGNVVRWGSDVSDRIISADIGGCGSLRAAFARRASFAPPHPVCDNVGPSRATLPKEQRHCLDDSVGVFGFQYDGSTSHRRYVFRRMRAVKHEWDAASL